jgi:hypothetical protein
VDSLKVHGRIPSGFCVAAESDQQLIPGLVHLSISSPTGPYKGIKIMVPVLLKILIFQELVTCHCIVYYIIKTVC